MTETQLDEIGAFLDTPVDPRALLTESGFLRQYTTLYKHARWLYQQCRRLMRLVPELEKLIDVSDDIIRDKRRMAAIITAYTGFPVCQVDDLAAYAKEKMGYDVDLKKLMLELGSTDFHEKLKQIATDDFEMLVAWFKDEYQGKGAAS